MLAIMKDTDDHFAQLNKKLEELRAEGKPHLTLVRKVDTDK